LSLVWSCRLPLLVNLQRMQASRSGLLVGGHLQSRPSCETTPHTCRQNHWNNLQLIILLAAWKRECDVPDALSSDYGECRIAIDSPAPVYSICNTSKDVLHNQSTPKSVVNAGPAAYSGAAAAGHQDMGRYPPQFISPFHSVSNAYTTDNHTKILAYSQCYSAERAAHLPFRPFASSDAWFPRKHFLPSPAGRFHTENITAHSVSPIARRSTPRIHRLPSPANFHSAH
jgi:hypothetical protein